MCFGVQSGKRSWKKHIQFKQQTHSRRQLQISLHVYILLCSCPQTRSQNAMSAPKNSSCPSILTPSCEYTRTCLGSLENSDPGFPEWAKEIQAPAIRSASGRSVGDKRCVLWWVKWMLLERLTNRGNYQVSIMY